MKKVAIFLMLVFVIIFLLTACPFTAVKYHLSMLEPDGEGIVDPDIGEYSIEEGKEVTINATPDNGWQFVKWEVNEEFYSNETEATLTMNTDKEIKAFFEVIPPEKYTLTMLQPDDDGSVDPSIGDHDYTEGTEVTLTATPDEGWQFAKWEVDSAEYSTDLTTTLTMNSDKEVKAFFEEIPPEKYTLTMLVPDGDGSVDPSNGNHNYNENTEVTLVATPDSDWQFDRWEVDGTEYSTEESTTLTMDSDKEVKAFFEEIPPEVYTLTMLVPDGNGEVSPATGTQTYVENKKITLTATPDDGWIFSSWEVNEQYYSSEESTTLIMDSDKQVKAIFEEVVPDKYKLTVVYTGSGSGDVSRRPFALWYDEGQKVELRASPNSCSEFAYWYGDVRSSNPKIFVTMDDHKRIFVYFQEKENTIDIVVDDSVATCTNNASEKFLLTFSSSDRSIDICDAKVVVSEGTEDLELEPKNGTRDGTLTWEFGKIDCETLFATITVEDCCGNVAQKVIELKVDNMAPRITTFDEGNLDEKAYEEISFISSPYSVATETRVPTPCVVNTQTNISWEVEDNALITVGEFLECYEQPVNYEYTVQQELPDELQQTEIAILWVHNINYVTLDSTSTLIMDLIEYPAYGVLKLNEGSLNSILTTESGGSNFYQSQLNGFPFIVVAATGEATIEYENTDCKDIYLGLAAWDNCCEKCPILEIEGTSNYSAERRSYHVDNMPPQVTFNWENNIEPEPCATEATMTFTIEDGSFYDNVCTAGILECQIKDISESYIALEIPPITTNSEFDVAASFEEIVDLNTEYEDGVYSGTVYIDVSGSDIGGNDCGTFVATLTGYDCCGECESKESDPRSLSFDFDSKPPKINEFTTKLNNDCNTATYTTFDWDISDGSYETDPQICDIATITVNHGYITSDPDLPTTDKSTVTDLASSTDSDLYWVLEEAGEGLDCVDVTATLTARDICCDCGYVFNKSAASVMYEVDNVPPEIELQVSSGVVGNSVQFTLSNDVTNWTSIKSGMNTGEYISSKFEESLWKVLWSINLSSLDGSELVAETIASDKCGNSSEASVTISVYALTMKASPTEGGTCSSLSNFYPKNTSNITIVATPNTDIGSTFTNWESTAGTITNPSANITTFTMPSQDATVIANFTLQYN